MSRRIQLPPPSELRATLLVFLLLIGASAARPQDPDLEGSWRLDIEASDERRNGPPLVDTEITIALTDEGVRIAREFRLGQAAPRAHEAVYVTDGKPHEVPGILTPSQEVRARWRKDKLRLSYTVARGRFQLDVNEVWSLDKQGDLEILYSTRVADRNVVRKEIYHRE